MQRRAVADRNSISGAPGQASSPRMPDYGFGTRQHIHGTGSVWELLLTSYRHSSSDRVRRAGTRRGCPLQTSRRRANVLEQTHWAQGSWLHRDTLRIV